MPPSRHPAARARRRRRTKNLGNPAGNLVDELLRYAQNNLKLAECRRSPLRWRRRSGPAGLRTRSIPTRSPRFLEIRYYQWKQLLHAGGDGRALREDPRRPERPKLATGSDEERLTVVGRLLVGFISSGRWLPSPSGRGQGEGNCDPTTHELHEPLPPVGNAVRGVPGPAERDGARSLQNSGVVVLPWFEPGPESLPGSPAPLPSPGGRGG